MLYIGADVSIPSIPPVPSPLVPPDDREGAVAPLSCDREGVSPWGGTDEATSPLPVDFQVTFTQVSAPSQNTHTLPPVLPPPLPPKR